jgi:6-phosphogluconate dehydrogenase
MQMTAKAELGMVGLGVMGRNFLLNIADHGFPVCGFDRDEEKIRQLERERGARKVTGVKSLQELAASLSRPRAVMLLVPAGNAVDSVIGEILPSLEQGDILIDGGNSHYSDTDRRLKELQEKKIHFLGVGVSGGEYGARHGPSIMPGGPREAYERVRPIFEAAAARVEEDPCVVWLGPGSAGHFVKMVHNGIEYALMELIAESYDLLKRGLELSNDELQAVYRRWNEGALNSFLVEITADIFGQKDERSEEFLIDRILDAARQKGTGMWTSEDALEEQAPVPAIDMAVVARNLSSLKEERERASEALRGPDPRIPENRGRLVDRIENALHAAFILSFAQGMAFLGRASSDHNYGLKLDEVARIWRGGCIIRAALLEEVRKAYRERPELPNLLLDQSLGGKVVALQEDLRFIVGLSSKHGIPSPGLMASLGYFDGYRSARLPANLIQAQRDYFGSHTYERMDAVGSFHTEWNREENR